MIDTRNPKGAPMSFKILVVDDELMDLETTKLLLESETDLIVQTTNDTDEAIRCIRSDPNGYAVVLLDFQMPGKDGVSLAKQMLALNPYLQIVMNSGDKSREALKKSFAVGVADFIEKDTDPNEFRSRIRQLCKKFEETVQTFELSPSGDEREELIRSIGMVGKSHAMADVATLVHQVAPKDCNVLIHGESGTGKELIARAIHKNSLRRQKPFVAINVGAIQDGLLESDLFGHERGAFTGADRAKVGKLKLADGGTVFLDEIGDMKIELQVKLLRFLQEGEIHPVGSVKTEKVDVRVVAASHVDLETAVLQGKFREDLFYRLNVVKITIPPLRARPEDIQPLIAHFQKVFEAENKIILMKTIRYLEHYPWKGNIRELENEMERLMTIVPANRIEPSHLSSKFFFEHANQRLGEFDCTYPEFISGLEQRERDYIVANLSKSSSLRDAVKQRMKAPLGTIYGRMKKLGIKGGETYEQSI
jgi:DNA-binding NtrC family response regulator